MTSAYAMEHGCRGHAIFGDIAERYGIDPNDEDAVQAFWGTMHEKLLSCVEREEALAEVLAETTSGLDVPSRHQKAMDLTDKAMAARRKGDTKLATAIFRQAYRYERQAALETRESYRPNDLGLPRGVLYYSAANLAIEAGELDEALEIARLGLAASPEGIAPQRLREAIERAEGLKAAGGS